MCSQIKNNERKYFFSLSYHKLEILNQVINNLIDNEFTIIHNLDPVYPVNYDKNFYKFFNNYDYIEYNIKVDIESALDKYTGYIYLNKIFGNYTKMYIRFLEDFNNMLYIHFRDDILDFYSQSSIKYIRSSNNLINVGLSPLFDQVKHLVDETTDVLNNSMNTNINIQIHNLYIVSDDSTIIRLILVDDLIIEKILQLCETIIKKLSKDDTVCYFSTVIPWLIILKCYDLSTITLKVKLCLVERINDLIVNYLSNLSDENFTNINNVLISRLICKFVYRHNLSILKFDDLIKRKICIDDKYINSYMSNKMIAVN
jgi:hypothetical protein